MNTVTDKERTINVCGMQSVRKQKVQAEWADEFGVPEFACCC